MRLIALGDIHVYRLGLAPRHLIGKRLAGQLNLWLNRRSRFDLDRLPSLIERIASLEPDLVVQTGDLTTTALHGEFAMARELLAPLAERFDLVTIPGNHDRYTFTAARQRRFEQHLAPWAPDAYPHHRQPADGLHLVALDPTRPTLVNASGRLGAAQLDALRALLRTIDPAHRLIVACHNPVGTPPDLPPEPRHHALIDTAPLVQTLRDHGAPTLYLHGHVHRPWCRPHPSAPNLVTINAGAAIMQNTDFPAGQGFRHIDIGGDNPWRVTHHIPRPDGTWREQTEAIAD